MDATEVAVSVDAGDELDAAAEADGLDADGAVDAGEVRDATGGEPEAAAISPAIDCDLEPTRCALCSGKYAHVPPELTTIVRGAWQYNPGGAFVKLSMAGYPCTAFLYDGPVRPTLDDNHWVAATDPETISFRTESTITGTEYLNVQFRYFRSMVFLPTATTVDSFWVTAKGIDDSVYLALYNSKYPNGVSPADAGPSDVAVGACSGNGNAAWNFKNYVQPGEINVVLVVQADMSPSTSSLMSVEITVNDAPIPLFDCSSAQPRDN